MGGVLWGSQDVTQDIDLAHASRPLTLGLPRNLALQTADAVESLDMGILPITGLGGKTGGSFLSPKPSEFGLDCLNPLHRGRDMPFVRPQLNVALQPLTFVEFALQGAEQAVNLFD